MASPTPPNSEFSDTGSARATTGLSNTMHPTTTPSDSGPPATGPKSTKPTISVIRAALSGLLAGAAALSIGELAGALAAPRPGPVTAVSNRVVDRAPTWFVNFGKDVFGLADKPALLLGTVIISLIAAAALGLAARKSFTNGIVGISVFGLIGLISMATDAQAGFVSALVVNAIAVGAGISVLGILLGLGTRASTVSTAAADKSGPLGKIVETLHPPTQMPTSLALDMPTDPAVARRSFLGFSAAIGAGSALGGLAANSLRSRNSAQEARDAVEIVVPEVALEVEEKIVEAAVTEVAATPGITPIVVPGKDFYRIDTALLVPQIDPASWQLTIKGMVDRELTYTFDELLERATTVEPVTLSCVSNEVGGGLVGNAVWQGVPLIELLDEAGIQPGATQISSRSVDGWDCGFPTDLAYDGRTALVAVAMNGEPLPINHGFPVRLVVSGLYGYVSATKWLSEIELTTIEDFNGYWIPRGWAKDAPVKTQSRIDTPRNFTTVETGAQLAIAGVAWAPNTGITMVEVQIDNEPWIEAELGESLGKNAWRQWRAFWTPTTGDHQIRVRATDATGATQTEERTHVAPDGASGWHTITIRV